MGKKAGYYIDKDKATWIRLGKLAILVDNPVDRVIGRPIAVWSWREVKRRWGPVTLDLPLSVD